VSPPPVDMQQDPRSEDLVQETYIRTLRAFVTLRDPTRPADEDC
jgi:DNA-directed RNA polymerase specialized sigma24 family protein